MVEGALKYPLQYFGEFRPLRGCPDYCAILILISIFHCLGLFFIAHGYTGLKARRKSTKLQLEISILDSMLGDPESRSKISISHFNFDPIGANCSRIEFYS